MKEAMIGPINPNLTMPEIKGPRIQEGKEGASFSDTLRDAISTVNELQKESNQDIQKLLTGENPDLHTTLIAVQKADLSFQMMMQVRNKLVQAYQEIMRTQV